ncbi:MAG: molybdopterin-dependent oxidoreductase [Candidatus Bathyarchaeota archaeon]|nr:molybdopterin-dependent oxidoreductase [Candidatus Bathyarchaeota archaeon]
MTQQTKTKTLTLTLLIILAATALTATTTALPSTATLTLKSGTNTTVLTAADILAMPAYTGIGAVRSGGSISPSTIGSYTGVPLLYLCNLIGGIQPTSYIKITASDGYSTMLSYDQVHDNNFVQYDINTNTVITDQDPLIIVAYAKDGAELTHDLGAPFRDVVVSEDGMATYGNVMVKYISSIEVINPPTTPLSCQTTDSSGAAQSTFNAGENVYLKLTGLSASTSYPVYVVDDVATWTVRVALPTPVSGSANSVTTDSSGNLAPTSIYPNAAPGKYDIILDVNSDGIYDEGDLLINNVVTTAGVFVLPEYSLGAFAAITACFAALIAYAALKAKTANPLLNSNRRF